MRTFKPVNPVQWLTLITLLCVAVTVPIIFVRLNDVSHSQNVALRTVLCFFENRTLQNPMLTGKQKQQAILIYNESLDTIHEHHCP